VRRLGWLITASPSYARSQTALAGLRDRGVPYVVLVTASALVRDYGAVVQHIEADGHPICRIESAAAGSTPISQALTDAQTGIALTQTLAQASVTDVVIVADRSETLSAAHAARALGLTIWHLQGGEVSGNIDDRIRDSNTCLADWHLVASETAAARVREIGADPARVIVTGCPSLDLAQDSRVSNRAPVTCAELGGTGADVDLAGPFALVLLHPVTDEYGQGRTQAGIVKQALAELEIPVVWQRPGPDAGAGDIARSLSRAEHEHADRAWHYFHRIAPARYYDLLRQCRVLVGNSSVGIRECAYLGVPVVNIGARQRGRDRGENVLDVGWDSAAIASAVQWQAWRWGLIPSSRVYGGPGAGARVAEAIAAEVGGSCPARAWTLCMG